MKAEVTGTRASSLTRALGVYVVELVRFGIRVADVVRGALRIIVRSEFLASARPLGLIRRIGLVQLWTTGLIAFFAFTTGYLLGQKGELPGASADRRSHAARDEGAPRFADGDTACTVLAPKFVAGNVNPEARARPSAVRRVDVEDLPLER